MGSAKYKFKEELIEGVIKSRPNRFIMMVEMGGKLLKMHCPSTGRIGGIVFEDVPCLVSMAEGTGRKTSGTVEAISLDPKKKKNKKWIGINQNRANEYVGYFIGVGGLSRMVRGKEVKKEVKLGESRIDFLVGKDYVEVKTPLIALPTSKSRKYQKQPRFDSFERLIRHFGELGKSIGKGSRAILLLCYMFDAEPFRPPEQDGDNSRIIRAARGAKNKGVENWQINLKIDRKGVELLDYFELELFKEEG